MYPAARFWPYLLGAAALAAAGFIWMRPSAGAGSSYLTAAVERGKIQTSISATGTLQAVLTVQVGSQVTGRIQSLHADFNSIVKKGQVIARIDPATFEASLVRSQADLEDARAGLSTARAELVNRKANLDASLTSRTDAERVHRRTTELSTEGVTSERDLEASEAAFNEASARVRQAEAQVNSGEAAIEQAQARVKQAQAQVRLAQVNLDYTVINSPVDGVIVSRNVDVGQTVAASLQAPTLFVIANDLTRMQVVANVDEADIGHLGPEARVAFTVDSFPGEFFDGIIDQIRLNPIVTQNVVTYSVIVNVANPHLRLRPGMTANTTFTVAESENALKLPNSALRFWPAEIPRTKEAELIEQARPETPEAPDSLRPEGSPGPERHRAAEGGVSPIASSEGVLRFPQIRKARFRPRVVWILSENDKPAARVVRVGITDGSASEVKEGDLADGDRVIIGTNQLAEASAPAASPFGSPFRGRPAAKGQSGGRRP